jgi:hypothetical protein
MRELSNQLVKLAKSIQLKKLIEAKRNSDKNEYSTKHKILAELLDQHPSEFEVDQILNDKYVGLVHKPTKFKIHAPRALIPVGIEQSLKKK